VSLVLSEGLGELTVSLLFNPKNAKFLSEIITRMCPKEEKKCAVTALKDEARGCYSAME
jgi:hypothetical protein